MTVFAKRTMDLTEWPKLRNQLYQLQAVMPQTHDLMMFTTKTDDPSRHVVYIGLPDKRLMVDFPGFEIIPRTALPDFLSTQYVREDRFTELFPDIAAKRRSQLV